MEAKVGYYAKPTTETRYIDIGHTQSYNHFKTRFKSCHLLSHPINWS